MYTVIKSGQVYYPRVSGNGKVTVWRDLPKPGVSEIGIQREGEEPTLLTNDRVAVNYPKPNQDGSVVVFERHGGRNWDWDIARVGPDTEGTQVIIDTPGKSADFDVSSDGNKVVADYWPREAPRIRHVDLWENGKAEVQQITDPEISSGLPEIAGDGGRVFYLRLPKTGRDSNAVWMREADGSEKPLIYEPEGSSERVQKSNYEASEDGTVLAWTQRSPGANNEVWRWDLKNGVKEMLGESSKSIALALSGDGNTVAWTESNQNDQGDWVSELHWKQGDEEKIVSGETEGANTYPSLSDDGNTLVWMWKHDKINFDHEIRKAVFE